MHVRWGLERTGTLLLVATVIGCNKAPPGAAEPDPPAALAPAPAPAIPVPEPGGEPAGSVANVAACRRYVQVFNDAPCIVNDLPADPMCPPMLDQFSCDMAPYYACMAENVKCVGDTPDVSGQSGCVMPRC